MGKVGRFLTLLCRTEVLVGLGASAVAVLSIQSAFISINHNVGLIGVAAAATIALLVALLLWARRLRRPELPPDEILGTDPDGTHTRVHCPCDDNLLAEATKLARYWFSGSPTISAETIEKIRIKNPYILACMTNSRGTLLGYFDVIPVKETFAMPFLSGAITEEHITYRDVLESNEMSRCKYLFISGLAVCNPDTSAGKRSAQMLVWALLKYLERFYCTSTPLAFAVAATPAGAELLRRFKVELKCEASERKDGYKLYTIILNREEVSKRLQCVLDWERFCILDWDSNVMPIEVARRPRRPRLPPAKARDRLPPRVA